MNLQIRWWICHRIWCRYGWRICHQIWRQICHHKWWQIQWVTKFGDKYVTISGDKFSESPNSVTNFSPNLVKNLVITKFGDKFVTKFVTKYPGGPICRIYTINTKTRRSDRPNFHNFTGFGCRVAFLPSSSLPLLLPPICHFFARHFPICISLSTLQSYFSNACLRRPTLCHSTREGEKAAAHSP